MSRGTERLRVFTAFSGYDSQLLALRRLARDFPAFGFECVGWSEIDRFAIQAHNALFPALADRNFGDISRIEWESVPDFDLFTMSSPCQDFSVAGLRRGGEEGSGTRSSLLWECRRAIAVKRPRYVLFENVKGLLCGDFLRGFMKWQDELAALGYANFPKVLNARDYGVPQNRERVFMVSILGFGGEFHFPRKIPLALRLRDVLEDSPAPRYRLSDSVVDNFLRRNERNGGMFRPVSPDGVSRTVIAEEAKRTTTQTYVDERYYLPDGTVEKYRRDNERLGPNSLYRFRTTDTDGVARPVLTVAGTNRNFVDERYYLPDRVVEAFLRRNASREGFQFRPRERDGVAPTVMARQPMGGTDTYVPDEGAGIQSLGNCCPDRRGGRALACAVRGRGESGSLAPALETGGDTANALTTSRKDSMVMEAGNIRGGEGGGQRPKYRIRRLTERECFRLMDVDERDIDTIQAAGISATRQYRLAGNSIVVSCLYHIFRKMFAETENEERQLTIW